MKENSMHQNKHMSGKRDNMSDFKTQIDTENTEEEKKYLTFIVDEHTFGISIDRVVEIIQMQEITPVPEYPAHFKGIINLRGRIISVIDIRIRINKNVIPYDDRTCIIILDIGGRHVGFIVDQVKEVIDIPLKSIADRTQMMNRSGNDYLRGFAKLNQNVILIIDIDKLLYETDTAYI